MFMMFVRIARSEIEEVWGKAAAPDQELGDDIICHTTI